jgi:urocanate hydratase
LAITMNGGTCLIADVDVTRLQRRTKDRYLDEIVDDLDEAISLAVEYARTKKALSVGVPCDAISMLTRLIERNETPAALTDQTSAHDVMHGYLPAGFTLDEAAAFRQRNPDDYTDQVMATIARHVEAMVTLQNRGSITFDYGNNLRQRAFDAGYNDAFAFPGFVPAFIRPQFCVGRGPFRWVALSGEADDIHATDAALLDAFPEDKSLHRWLTMAKQRVAFQGLPARICWFGLGERAKAGLLFNEMVRDGKVKSPIVIGRDHLDCGSVASPNRETEGMKDGSDAISDWPILNAMVNVASGASWVSFHHGGGVGIGYSQHAGQVIVADGSAEAAECLKRVLTNDPAMGILRHADAGYDEARRCADDMNVDIPMRDWKIEP